MRWNDEITAQVIDLWRAGESAGDIARAIGDGLTRSAVLGKMKRLEIRQGNYQHKTGAIGDRSRYGRKDRFEFSADHDATIIAEVTRGRLRQYEIADLVGCNANQIVTRIVALRRAKLLPEAAPRPVREAAPKRPKGTNAMRSGRWSLGAAPTAFQASQRALHLPYREKSDSLAPAAALDDRGVRFTMLTGDRRFHCFWPHGDPAKADFHICGNTNKPGSPYCPYHTRRAHSARADDDAEAA